MEEKGITAGGRYHKLDALRGLTLLSMAAYHGMWDLVYLFGVKAPWYHERAGYIWQQSICWTFILLSGFCWKLGSAHLKRGCIVFFAGAVVTAVTCLFMPESRIIFGVLTLIGSAMLLLIPMEKVLRRIPGIPGLAGAFLLFLFTRPAGRGYFGFDGAFAVRVPASLYSGYLSTWLGLPFPGFQSPDYFPLIPWFFLYLCGYFLNRIFLEGLEREEGLIIRLADFLKKPLAAPLEWMGRHSLLVYMLHQPVIYGLLTMLLIKRGV